MNNGVCCFGKEFDSEFNTSLTALKGGVLNSSHTIDFSAFSGIDAYNIIRVLTRQIALICNSGFFLISGFLFFINIDSWNKTAYLKKLKTRVRTLLIPYLLWNIINVAIRPAVIVAGRLLKRDWEWDRFSIFLNELSEKGIWNIFWHYNTWGDTTNILGWPKPSMGPFSVPMWFLQTLIVLTVLTPIIYLICRYLRICGIILLGLLYYTGIWFSVPGFSIAAIFFFSLGAYFGISKRNLVLELRKYKVLWYTVAALTLLPSAFYSYDGYTTYNFFSPIFILAGVISAVNIASSIAEKGKLKPNRILAQSTFFIYGVHTPLVLGIVGLVFDIVFKSQHPIVLTLRYFAVPIITAYACVLVYRIMKKIMPKILGLLSGNR